MMLIISVIGLFIIVFFLSIYRVVNPNEAHIIVLMGRGRKLYTPVVDHGNKTSYFLFPIITKRFVLPLTNVKLDIKDIQLNDIKVAPFTCDVITWVHIENPIKAAERLDHGQQSPFVSLHNDLINLVQAVARTAAMKQEILDIMRDRQTFSNSVFKEVDGVLLNWGVKLVNLEINDIRDQQNSNVIANYEAIRKTQVESTARIEIAQRNREAVEAEQDNRKKAEIAKAEAEALFTVKQIERDKTIGVAEQAKELEIAKQQEVANTQKVLATRKLEVGTASVKKEATIELATGEAEAIRIKGEKEAQVIQLTGVAQASAIEAKGLAEAVAKDKMAEALKKYNDAATAIEKIKAMVEIQKAFADAYAKIAENAEIKIVNSGKGGNILGLDLNAETGANLGQMLEGFDLNKIKNLVK